MVNSGASNEVLPVAFITGHGLDADLLHPILSLLLALTGGEGCPGTLPVSQVVLHLQFPIFFTEFISILCVSFSSPPGYLSARQRSLSVRHMSLKGRRCVLVWSADPLWGFLVFALSSNDQPVCVQVFCSALLRR